MFSFFKNKYLPLKNNTVDSKTREYLIKKLTIYCYTVRAELYKRYFESEELVERGYPKDDAVQILNIKELESFDENLSRIMTYVMIYSPSEIKLSDDDIKIINNIYSKIKLRFNVFNL